MQTQTRVDADSATTVSPTRDPVGRISQTSIWFRIGFSSSNYPTSSFNLTLDYYLTLTLLSNSQIIYYSNQYYLDIDPLNSHK